VGAWGCGPLENDDAADFIAAIAQMTNAGLVGVVIGDALLAVTASGGYIEAPEMSRAIAAATVIAILHNAELPMPSTLSRPWLDALELTPSNEIVTEAAAVFSRAFEANDNEWYELWADAELVDEVRDRLAPYASAIA
jgi:hypothetical protein